MTITHLDNKQIIYLGKTTKIIPIMLQQPSGTYSLSFPEYSSTFFWDKHTKQITFKD